MIYIYVGSRGTVIEAPSRKDGKLKVKLDNDNTKTFRLIKEGDLQLYEGVASLTNKGETRLQATPSFNDGAAISETHDTEHIRNDSIRHTSVRKTFHQLGSWTQ